MKKRIIFLSLAVCFIAVNIIGAKKVINNDITIDQMTAVSTAQAEWTWPWNKDDDDDDDDGQGMGWCADDCYDMMCGANSGVECSCDCCVYTCL